MIFRKALLIALCSTASESFTPSSSSKQWNKIGQQHKTTQLFDTESSSVWTAEKWTAESIISESFSPTKSDFSAAKKALSKSKSNQDMSAFISSKHGIESEYPNKRKLKASVKETGTDSMKHYIKTMCNHELLNKNEEIILAREIQILLKWEDEREQLEQQLLR
jgi:hypothetical protein